MPGRSYRPAFGLAPGSVPALQPRPRSACGLPERRLARSDHSCAESMEAAHRKTGSCRGPCMGQLPGALSLPQFSQWLPASGTAHLRAPCNFELACRRGYGTFPCFEDSQVHTGRFGQHETDGRFRLERARTGLSEHDGRQRRAGSAAAYRRTVLSFEAELGRLPQDEGAAESVHASAGVQSRQQGPGAPAPGAFIG